MKFEDLLKSVATIIATVKIDTTIEQNNVKIAIAHEDKELKVEYKDSKK